MPRQFLGALAVMVSTEGFSLVVDSEGMASPKGARLVLPWEAVPVLLSCIRQLHDARECPASVRLEVNNRLRSFAGEVGVSLEAP